MKTINPYPDFEAARTYVLTRLDRELSETIFYHSAWHTRDEVFPQVNRLIEQEQLTGRACLWVRTAALYHDIGFTRSSIDHERTSIQIATRILPRFGYSPSDIRSITGIIMATRLPQSAHTLPEKILADADLDVLGRRDFFTRNQLLRAELAASGTVFSDEAWLSGQLDLLQSHSYFTASAHRMRQTGKLQNIEKLNRALSRCRKLSAHVYSGPYPQIHHLLTGISLASRTAIH
jgi:uncharacterized protein